MQAIKFKQLLLESSYLSKKTFHLHLHLLPPCRGPVSPHTSPWRRALCLCLSYEIHATPQRLIKNRVPKQTMNCAEFTCYRFRGQRGASHLKYKQHATTTTTTITTSILCLHRVLWCSICQVLPKCHMQILWCTLKMTDCVTNFRKYSI